MTQKVFLKDTETMTQSHCPTLGTRNERKVCICCAAFHHKPSNMALIIHDSLSWGCNQWEWWRWTPVKVREIKLKADQIAEGPKAGMGGGTTI